MFRNRLLSVLLTMFLLINLPTCAALSETAEGSDYRKVCGRSYCKDYRLKLQ